MRILFMMAVRSGSKGVKNKNIRDLGGIPLLGHAIKAVQNSKAYKNDGYLFVNTDSEEYAEIARTLGAKTPFLRSADMAADKSPIIETLKYSFDKFEEMNEKFDAFALVQATSPFTLPEDIDRGVGLLLQDPSTKSVISVTEADVPPVWCNVLDDTLSMKDFISTEIRQKNRQELPKYYKVTGAIRIARWDEFKQNNFDWYFDDSKALIIDKLHSVDIDTEEDFSYAEFLYTKLKK